MRELYVARAEAGLSLVELARRSGVHYTTISDIEQGKRKAQTATLAKLAKALDIPVSRLLGDSTPKVPAPLLRLNFEQRRDLVSILAGKGFPPITGEIKRLAEIRRAAIAKGASFEEFNQWFTNSSAEAVRRELLPEDVPLLEEEVKQAKSWGGNVHSAKSD